jgi:CRISPR-associated protein Cmr4
MISNLVYLYLIAPLHTGGATQEGNLLGIARESHTDLPYVPSSTVRGRLRATADADLRPKLFGTDLADSDKLEQGDIWIGDASILWLPVPSLSHGVIWISCPMLLQRWARLRRVQVECVEYGTNLSTNQPIYLKDAILKPENLKPLNHWQELLPVGESTQSVKRVLILPDQHCATLIQMSLWRQVKIKLDEHKTVDGGFRYEEAIPPDTLMFFPWGTTSQANGSAQQSSERFTTLLSEHEILQIGGQESLGRGFVQQWMLSLVSN